MTKLEAALRVALAEVLASCRTRLRLELPTELPAVPHDVELLGRVFAQLAENASEAMGGAGGGALFTVVLPLGPSASRARA